MKISGIYKIYNKQSKKTYIGSSKEIEKRWGLHLSQLNKNNHVNKHLQRAWNKYGESAFEFSILEKVEPSELLKVEQLYLDSADYKMLYNISTKANAPSQEYRMIPLYLLDLSGNILKKFRNGAELCSYIGYKRQLSYGGINTKAIVMKKYRIVSVEFYENNKNIIDGWPYYKSFIREQARQKLLFTEIHRVIKKGKLLTVTRDKKVVAKMVGRTTERVRQVTRKKNECKLNGFVIKTDLLLNLLDEVWFLQSDCAKSLKIEEKRKKLKISKQNRHLFQKN